MSFSNRMVCVKRPLYKAVAQRQTATAHDSKKRRSVLNLEGEVRPVTQDQFIAVDHGVHSSFISA
jgi:hypothetical protein